MRSRPAEAASSELPLVPVGPDLAAPLARVLSAGVGARDAARYPIRLASFRLEPGSLGRAALGIITPPSPASAVLVGLLSGRLAPAYGELRVLGHDVRSASGRAAVRAGTGLAATSLRTWPMVTIRGLVSHAARRSGQPRRDRGLLVAAILDRLDLGPWGEVALRAAPELVARRARLAAACVHEPDLLIVNGLFDHLPAMERAMLADIVKDLRRDTSIVALGQDADTLLLFCDQLAILSGGVLIGQPPCLPPAAVHQVVEVTAPDHLGRPALVQARVRMADGERADRHVLAGYAELVTESPDSAVEQAEEQGTQALVDGREQHEHGHEPGVDVPVRHRPAGLVPVGPALVRPGVPVQVDVLARQRHDYHRRPGHGLEPGLQLLVVAFFELQLPERPPLVRLVEQKQRVPLAEPGRRRPVGRPEYPLDGFRADRLGTERPDHPPLGDYVIEFHRAIVRRDYRRLLPWTGISTVADV
jgi:ABC-2 type transport system ATP-binding protein